MPVPTITDTRLSECPQDTVFVVYRAGPHCSGATKAATQIAKLRWPLKR